MPVDQVKARHEEMRVRLQDAMIARARAVREYREAILEAKNQGWSNSEIARTVGVSEAAIRLYWQRHRRDTVARVKAGSTPKHGDAY